MVILESRHFVVSYLTDGERAEKESVRGNGGGGHPMPANALSTWILAPFLTNTDKYSLSDKYKQIQTDEGRSTLIVPYHISEFHQCFCCFRTVAELGLEKHYFHLYGTPQKAFLSREGGGQAQGGKNTPTLAILFSGRSSHA